jgi:hypothetical protein
MRHTLTARIPLDRNPPIRLDSQLLYRPFRNNRKMILKSRSARL